MGQTRMTPVAVVGKGCQLAGGIASPELVWEALLPVDALTTEVQ